MSRFFNLYYFFLHSASGKFISWAPVAPSRLCWCLFVCVSCTQHNSSSGVPYIYLYDTDVFDVFAVTPPEKKKTKTANTWVCLLWSHRLSGSAGSAELHARRRSSHYLRAAAVSQYRSDDSSRKAVEADPTHTHTRRLVCFLCFFFPYANTGWVSGGKSLSTSFSQLTDQQGHCVQMFA